MAETVMELVIRGNEILLKAFTATRVRFQDINAPKEGKTTW